MRAPRRLMGGSISKNVASLASVGQVLRVVFYRQEDRIAHRIARGDTGQVILTSMEGSAADVWPLSPPLQELHESPAGSAGALALLVGMAGRSHWSMSAQVLSDAAGVSFDLACRAQALPARLGSRYLIAPQVNAEMDGDAVFLCRADASWRVRLSGSGCRLRLEQQTIEIEATQAPSSLPATIRWRYAVESISDCS